MMAAYFAYIVESPFLLTSLGLPASYIGVSFPIFLGNLTARWLFKREIMEKTVGRGYIIFVIGGGLFALQMYEGWGRGSCILVFFNQTNAV